MKRWPAASDRNIFRKYFFAKCEDRDIINQLLKMSYLRIWPTCPGLIFVRASCCVHEGTRTTRLQDCERGLHSSGAMQRLLCTISNFTLPARMRDKFRDVCKRQVSGCMQDTRRALFGTFSQKFSGNSREML